MGRGGGLQVGGPRAIKTTLDQTDNTSSTLEATFRTLSSEKRLRRVTSNNPQTVRAGNVRREKRSALDECGRRYVSTLLAAGCLVPVLFRLWIWARLKTSQPAMICGQSALLMQEGGEVHTA